MTTTPPDAATGVPHPDEPGGWLVPPWPVDARLDDVVDHFTHHCARLGSGPNDRAHRAAAFRGYLHALDTIPHRDAELADPARRDWYADLRAAVVACVNANEGE